MRLTPTVNLKLTSPPFKTFNRAGSTIACEASTCTLIARPTFCFRSASVSAWLCLKLVTRSRTFWLGGTTFQLSRPKTSKEPPSISITVRNVSFLATGLDTVCNSNVFASSAFYNSASQTHSWGGPADDETASTLRLSLKRNCNFLNVFVGLTILSSVASTIPRTCRKLPW